MVAKIKKENKPAFQAPVDGETGEPANVKTTGWGLDGQQVPAPDTTTPEPPTEEPATESVGEEVAQPKPKRKKKSDVAPDTPDNALAGVNDTMAADLIRLVENIERGNEEVEAAQADVKEFYAEAKAKGYSPKIIREAVRRRAMDVADREEHDTQLALYEDAINRGMKGEDE